MNQVQLNPTKLSIVSIKRTKYWLFKSALLELLYYEIKKTKPNESDPSDDETGDEDAEVTPANASIASRDPKSPSSASSTHNSSKTDVLERRSSAVSDPDFLDLDNDYFFHIAFTPVECTVICSTTLMTRLFNEPLKICKEMQYDDVKLIDQKFVSLQIDSGGNYDNHYRILELTKPLSDNDISLFFLSTHFSDIVLIPCHLEQKVIKILCQNDFEFSDASGSYIVNNNFNRSSPVQEGADEKSLVNKTFKAFRDANIKPVINEDIALLLTGARSTEVSNTVIKTANNIATNNIPDYFAITQTSINEVSLVLPKSSRLRAAMGFNSKHLIGSTQDVIFPITIDLQKLPLDSTGIVAGVASKIINGINEFPESVNLPFEMNYFSMARSAIIMIPIENIEVVTAVLNNIDYDKLATDMEDLCLTGSV